MMYNANELLVSRFVERPYEQSSSGEYVECNANIYGLVGNLITRENRTLGEPRDFVMYVRQVLVRRAVRAEPHNHS